MKNIGSKGTGRSLDELKIIVVCVMLGTLMFISDIFMEFLPNVHIIGVLTVIYTSVYRSRALISIYVYAFINGLVSGFGFWWISYLYIWTILWGLIMIIPRRLPEGLRTFLYILIATLHGLSFGILYLPIESFFVNSDRTYLFAWWIKGFITSDILQGLSACIFGIFMIKPISKLLVKLNGSLISVK